MAEIDVKDFYNSGGPSFHVSRAFVDVTSPLERRLLEDILRYVLTQQYVIDRANNITYKARNKMDMCRRHSAGVRSCSTLTV